ASNLLRPAGNKRTRRELHSQQQGKTWRRRLYRSWAGGAQRDSGVRRGASRRNSVVLSGARAVRGNFARGLNRASGQRGERADLRKKDSRKGHCPSLRGARPPVGQAVGLFAEPAQPG